MVRLWRRHGLSVSVIHSLELPEDYRSLLHDLGCDTYLLGVKDSVDLVPGIHRAVVIGVCHTVFLEKSHALRQLGCRLVWLNLMTSIGATEGLLYEDAPPFDCYVFESPFQLAKLSKDLTRYGVHSVQAVLIPGPLEISDWEYAPRPVTAGGDFVIGKLARPDIAKWSRRTWDIYGMVDHPRRKALVMGVDKDILGWIGHPPVWGTVLPPGAIPTRDYYRQIHCLMPVNFAAFENWPRVGLEAMACGVPIVAPREGGWCDMIIHGETGFLASSPKEFADYATALSRDETLRLKIAHQARQRLVEDLARSDKIWAQWERVFHDLAN